MAARVLAEVSLSYLSPRIRRHIRALRYTDERSYLSWCKGAGFVARTNKNPDQMKQEVRRRRADEALEDRTSSLSDHIRRLGFDTIGSYRTWCRRNEQGSGLHKSAAGADSGHASVG